MTKRRCLQLPLPWSRIDRRLVWPPLEKARIENMGHRDVAALAHYYQDNEGRRDWLILTARLPHNVTAWRLLINLAYEEHNLFHPFVRTDLQNKLDTLQILERMKGPNNE